MEFHLEKNSRKSRRHKTIGLMSNITDGKTTYVGVVEDISQNGLRISQVPTAFDDTVEMCYSVVNGFTDDFAVALQPRWVAITNRGMYKTIGFEIENPPAEWTAFVERVKEKIDPVACLMAEKAIAA